MSNLTLHRRVGEALVLFDTQGREIGRVRILNLDDGYDGRTQRVKVLCSFPAGITILREELVERDRQQAEWEADQARARADAPADAQGQGQGQGRGPQGTVFGCRTGEVWR